ncbi:hypothetical protein [Anaeromyxobacter diazotrophicus]|uniref:PD-(D/E)XK nuclease superfamily protein n=1 Tax=Anaeromyxobacter diazotrophicus TaxID=2590199 RepID=A0A7I9VKL5_9BACT|nr:hypothetical protein [Anaeromyxobacter diazotrophicus]GEJ56659.1 hypothetical protein AMYX_14000 [Anaeromyxobacter diazotrophicus]
MEPTSFNPLHALLAENEEDRFTEALSHLLRHGNLAERFLLEFADVKTSGVAVQTQLVVLNGRPDVVFTAPSVTVVLEAKLASWLHDDQLLPYVEWLDRYATANGTDSILLLLGPRCSLAAMHRDAKAQVGNRCSPKCVTWEQVAAFCEAESASRAGSDLGTYLRDFARLIEHRLGPAPRPFTAAEEALLRDGTAALAFAGALRATQALHDALARDSSIHVGGFNSSTLGYEGFQITKAKRWWWAGLWLEAWPAAVASPLILQLPGLSKHSSVVPPKGLPVPVCFQVPGATTGWMVSPLPLLAGVDPEQLANAHADQVLHWIRDQPASGGVLKK